MNSNKTEIWTVQGSTEAYDATTRSAASSVQIQPAAAGNENEQYFFKNNSFLVGVQSKFRRKYYHKTVFSILLLIILLLIIGLIVIILKAKFSNNICETNQCLRAASNLLLSMDQTVDPCDDFYEFTCGNWHEEHPKPDSSSSYDWFSDKQNNVNRKIRTFLQGNQTAMDPSAVNKSKIMYRACMNVDAMNQQKLNPVLRLLKQFHLPTIPSILNRTQIQNNSTLNDIENFNWIESLVRIKLIMGMDILIGFDIFADPKNRSINRIAIGSPESGSPLPFNNDGTRKKKIRKKLITDFENLNFDNDLNEMVEPTKGKKSPLTDALVAYITYVRKILFSFVTIQEPDVVLDDELLDTLNTVALESLKLTAIIGKITEDAENSTKSTHTNPLEDILYLKAADVENATNDLITPMKLDIWTIYLPLIFQNQSESIKNKFNISAEKLMTSNADLIYLQSIKELITQLSKEKLQFYLWWSIVDELIDHTTTEMRQYHNDYTKVILKTESSTARSLYCANGVNTLMGMAVSYSLVNQSSHYKTITKMNEMLENIREAFNNLVRSTNWMDEMTKKNTLEKSQSMKSLIGFPKWITNKTRLDEYYAGVNVNRSKYLENMVGVLTWQMLDKFKEYEKPKKFGWATAPSNVNAFHTFQSNTITIPIAILQYPFYDLGLEALNYGAIGTILGHELTHGFDDSGRMFDKDGNMRQWWTEKTIKAYVNRTYCFINQYGGYRLPGADENIDGELTLGENIADNGGLREAFYAYQIYKKQNGDEKLLPGLDRYNQDQLLFISFGNLWCETLTSAGIKFASEDTHCPGRIRLKGVLSNSPEFSKTFQCKIGSGMFPTSDRCQIW